MKRVSVSILASILIILIPTALSAYKLTDTWHRSFAVAEGAAFVLDNVSGGIEIEGWNENGIDVSAAIKIKAPSKSKAKELRRKLAFKVDADRDRVRIGVDRPRIRQVGFLSSVFGGKMTITITYTVRVPPGTSLEIENTNGSIGIHEASGAFDVDTVNGDITIDSFGGEGEASTSNGSIRCSIHALPPDGDLTLTSVNGGIDVRLPAGVGGRLVAKTVNGGIDCNLTLRETMRKKRSSLRGVLGDGDGTVYLKTINGGIDIDPY